MIGARTTALPSASSALSRLRYGRISYVNVAPVETAFDVGAVTRDVDVLGAVPTELNAAMSDGGRVHLRARARGRAVVLALADTGVGIPKDALKKLGRPFEQVESLLTKTQQGSGLGLAIAKSLTELHGGALRIRSTLDKGTTVVVRLPLEPA